MSRKLPHFPVSLLPLLSLIHTVAYWLMLTLRGLASRTSFWRDAQFDTTRLCLIKVAGRITEMVTRIKIALPTPILTRPASPISPAALPNCRRKQRGHSPPNQPLRATSNPDDRVPDATKNHATAPPSDHKSYAPHE